MARDLGVSSLESSATILVEVLDVNDNAPRCLTDVHKVQLVEDWPPGSLVTCIQAADPDDGLNGKFTFGLFHRVQLMSLFMVSASFSQ